MTSTEEFAKAVLKVVISQILQSMGYQTVEPRALEVLVDVAVACEYLLRILAHAFKKCINTHFSFQSSKDIDELGYRSAQFTTLAHRTEPNFFDVAAALSEMAANMKQLETFAQFADELPFAHSK